MVRRHKQVAFLITVTVALGACGGGDEPRLTKTRFIEQGSAICGESSARIDSAAQGAFSEPGNIPTADEITEFATDTVAPTIENEIERLGELRPPEADEERIEEMLQAGSDGVDRVRQDPTVILSSNDDGFGRYQELSQAYGLENCGGGGDVTRAAIEGRTGGG